MNILEKGHFYSFERNKYSPIIIEYEVIDRGYGDVISISFKKDRYTTTYNTPQGFFKGYDPQHIDATMMSIYREDFLYYGSETVILLTQMEYYATLSKQKKPIFQRRLLF